MTAAPAVQTRRIGPLSETQARQVRLLETKGRWGYAPEILNRDGQWFVVMRGDADARAAQRLVENIR